MAKSLHPKFFNTAGPCDPDRHYMLPPERRLPDVRKLIDQAHYFVVHAPRQVGKTTTFRALAEALQREGRYTVLYTTCEAGEAAGSDLESGISGVLQTLRQDSGLRLPPELRPPAVDPSFDPTTRLRDLLIRWTQSSPLPVILFLDEIDALQNGVLLSVLRQLRSGYPERPRNFPQSVALIGLRDVRDYRVRLRSDAESLGTASPFNIKVESLTLRNFTAEEVAELYDQHTAATGQTFTVEAKALAFELTGGQPWLVNALARQAVETLAPDPAEPITGPIIDQAKEILIQRRDTHLDSLIDRLREPRVRRVIEPIVAGEALSPEAMNDDIQFVKDLGLVVSSFAGLAIANPIYREVIPRALTSSLEEGLSLPRPTYIGKDGLLRFDLLLVDFKAFWCQNAEAYLTQAPYSEAAAQLVFMAFLQKIVNGGGFIDREYSVGRGRIDLCVRYPYPGGVERWAVELKVWRDRRKDPLEEGLSQLSGYLAHLGLDRGTLILFDARTEAAALPDRCSLQEIEHDGRRISLLRL
jgi:hypothetical protein